MKFKIILSYRKVVRRNDGLQIIYRFMVTNTINLKVSWVFRNIGWYTIGLLCPFAAVAQLYAFPAPTGVELNKRFTVQVKQANQQQWQQLPSYNVKVKKNENLISSEENASMAYFSAAGKVEVAIQSNTGIIHTARIRPLSYGIKPILKDNSIYFTLEKPCNVSVEINGDIFRNLHLFADPIYEPVDSLAKNVIYFKLGLHQLKDGVLRVPSNTTVYIAGGAFIKGQIIFDSVYNSRLLGSGIIDPSSSNGGIIIRKSKHIEVEGVISCKCFTGGSTDVRIKNVKAISAFQWGDGMNVVSSNNVLLDGVFNRNSDDCTTVYGTRGRYSGGCNNVTMQNSTLWADVAHPILIGTHGSTPNKDTLQNLNYTNIDILDHNEGQIDYQGCMSINAGDNNLVKNVRFENIRVEDFRKGQLLNVRVFFNSKYCTSPGRSVENVLFKNIVYHGEHAAMSVIDGYSDDRKVKNIVFENLVINGKLYYDGMKEKPGWYKTADMAGIYVGNHTEEIIFKRTK
jgi:hypothetical protein